MQTQICEEKLIEIFIAVDDFTNLFQQWLTTRSLAPARQPTRQTELATSEILTILVYYGTGHPAPLRLQKLPILLSAISRATDENLLPPLDFLSAFHRPHSPPNPIVACGE